MTEALDLEMHGRLCRLICRVYRCSHVDGEDAASDAILAGLETGITNFSYLARAAKNAFFDRWNGRRRETPTERLPDVSTPPPQDIALAASEAARAMEGLSPKRREVMRLIARGWEPIEVRNALGISSKALDFRLHESRAVLRSIDFCELREKPRGHRQFVGVNPYYRKFVAKLKVNGKTVYLGVYKTAVEAAVAYDQGATRLLGNRAVLNFPAEAVRA